MPSLPTSLIIVVLVIAWLVVLVPMVAGRREKVPENVDEGANLRVIRRDGRSVRRRAVLSRTAMHRTRPDSAGTVDADAAVGDVGGGDVVRGVGSDVGSDVRSGEIGGGADVEVADTVVSEVAGEVRDRVADETSGDVADDLRVDAADDIADETVDVIANGATGEAGDEVTERASDGVIDDEAASPDAAGIAVAALDEVRGAAKPAAPQRVRSDVEETVGRAMAEYDDGGYGHGRYGHGGETRMVDAGDDDAAAPRARAVRPGRGGYDPVVAKQASDYRFRQRRRVALALVIVALAGSVAGLLGFGYGYMTAIAGGSVLVLYLAYLRRQTQIENEIRQRRAARLARARQIRPGYRPSVAEQVYAHRTGEIPRPGVVPEYTVKSHARQTVPPRGYGYGEPVDFEDNDPAFDDLEYYRPAQYRRRAG